MLEVVRARLSAAGLDRVASGIVELARPAVRLTTRRAERGVQPVGGSRIGGAPDLPVGAEWPTWKGRPLAFLAQLSLSELRRYPFCDVLPEDGVLQFFYDSDQETWGFDPRDRGSWRVLFHDGAARLQPTVGRGGFRPCRVAMGERLTLPPWESYDMDQLGLTREECDAYLDVTNEIEDAAGEDDVQHQVLGNPAAIQGDMQRDCQLASNGVYCGDASGLESAQGKLLLPGAGDWRLLFQLDSEEAADMTWGDCGRLYFWMTTSALRERRFDAAWMCLQCT